MKKSSVPLTFSFSLMAAFAVSLLTSGCGQRGADASAELQTVGFVPNSHFILQVDFADILQSPVMKSVEASLADLGEDFDTSYADFKKEFTEFTGMNLEDFGSLLISANLDNVDMEEVMDS